MNNSPSMKIVPSAISCGTLFYKTSPFTSMTIWSTALPNCLAAPYSPNGDHQQHQRSNCHPEEGNIHTMHQGIISIIRHLLGVHIAGSPCQQGHHQTADENITDHVKSNGNPERCSHREEEHSDITERQSRGSNYKNLIVWLYYAPCESSILCQTFWLIFSIICCIVCSVCWISDSGISKHKVL